jgi:transcriptional regulator GlxA family with amidase domain
MDAVAEAVGFDTAMTLRHHFRRVFGTTPTAYRRRFSIRAAESPRMPGPRRSLRRAPAR